MTDDRKFTPPVQPDDFVGFVANERGVSRDLAQAVLGEWLLHYCPSERARHMAEEQARPVFEERATNTPAA